MAGHEINMLLDQLEKKPANGGVGENVLEDGDSGTKESDPQQLDRYIKLTSTMNFSYIVLCSWEAFAVTFQFALSNGGPASMVYGCVIVSLGASAVALSLSELASIDPTVGAQYRWSANLAPFAPKFWGLLQGWITVFAWLMACAGPPAIIATMIVPLAEFTHPNYVAKTWHTMLLMWALICIPFLFNLKFRKLLNLFEILGGVFHMLFFIVTIIVLVTLARRSTTDFVFKTLTTGVSGWNNRGICFGLGLLTISFPVSGADAVIHMSDEVQKVSTRVPKGIWLAVVTNSIMLFAFVITVLFTLGDIDKVTASPLPIIEVYYEATQSKAGTVILVAMPALILFVALFNAFASVSRLVWAFARDKGLPFSKTFSYVHPKLRLPVNALALIGFISFLLSIIYVGSTTAFNAIISLQAIALNLSYVFPILFMLIRRLRGRHPQYGPFKLGAAGIPINIAALVYTLFVILWMPFPTILPVTGSNMNYAGPILVAVLIGACVDYAVSGRKRFQVPMHPKIN